MRMAKTEALISFADRICKSRFSHGEAHITRDLTRVNKTATSRPVCTSNLSSRKRPSQKAEYFVSRKTKKEISSYRV